MSENAERERMISEHLPFARMLAATLFGRRTHDDVEFGDYLQFARIGLIEAVDRFDPGRGVQFKTFASKRIRGAMLNGLARFTEKNQQISIATRLRRERIEALTQAPPGTGVDAAPRVGEALFHYLADVGVGLALGILLESTGMIDNQGFTGQAVAPSPEVGYFRKTELQRLGLLLRDHVDRLGTQQQAVIRCHYLQEIPFDEVAAILGVTRGRISQLHREGLLQLRAFLRDDARCDVLL